MICHVAEDGRGSLGYYIVRKQTALGKRCPWTIAQCELTNPQSFSAANRHQDLSCSCPLNELDLTSSPSCSTFPRVANPDLWQWYLIREESRRMTEDFEI